MQYCDKNISRSCGIEPNEIHVEGRVSGDISSTTTQLKSCYVSSLLHKETNIIIVNTLLKIFFLSAPFLDNQQKILIKLFFENYKDYITSLFEIFKNLGKKLFLHNL